MDARKRAAAGALLLDAGSTGRLAEHPSLRDKDDVTVGELLLKLPGQPIERIHGQSSLQREIAHEHRSRSNTPLLNLVESLELGDGDEDDDSLLAAADIDLAGSRDLEGAQLTLELGCAVLEVDDSLRDGSLSLIGGRPGRVGRAEDLVLNGHLEA